RRPHTSAASSRGRPGFSYPIPRLLPIPADRAVGEAAAMGPGSQALRKGRVSTAGQVYLVTFATERRQPHFREWDVAADAARLIRASTAWQDSRLLAWVLMPDHWHGMVDLGDGATLAGCVGVLRGCSARILRWQHPASGWIWSSG